MLLRTALSALSPAGSRARLSILIFHRVLDEPDPLFPGEIDRHRFEEITGWIARWFNVLSLGQAIQHLSSGTLPARAAVITFDDGYADNWTNAVPILAKRGLSGTFFIATGFLNGGRMWNDTIIESVRRTEVTQLDLTRFNCGTWSIDGIVERRAALGQIISRIKHLPFSQRDEVVRFIAEVCAAKLPTDLMMTDEQLSSLAASGMEIGAHTRSHPILTRIDDDQAIEEIQASREYLSTLLSRDVDLFAYPNGRQGDDFDARHVRMVRELGFRAAVATNAGAANGATDIFRLPRFTPWDQSRVRFGIRMVANLRTPLQPAFPMDERGVRHDVSNV